MRKLTFLAAALTAGLVTTSAYAQTVGIAVANRGWTSQGGAALSKVISEKSDVKLRSQAFGGTSIYVPQVGAGDIEFGLANELETYYAVTGTGVYDGRKMDKLQVAAVLVPFRSVLGVKKDSDIKSVADLKGKRVPAEWTAAKVIQVLMEASLANAGLTYDDVKQVPTASPPSSVDDFMAGKTDVFFFALGGGKIQEADAKVGGVRILPIDTSDSAIAAMRKFAPPVYSTEVKPGGNNTGVLEPIMVMAYDYLLLTNEGVSDDVVYNVVKTMHESKPELVAAFPGMGGFSTDRMAKPLVEAEFHKGAIKYYEEIGQWPLK